MSAMTFYPGHNYYILSSDDFGLLQEFMGEYEGESFLSDFEKVGNDYYAEEGSISDSEYAFLDSFLNIDTDCK